MFKAILIEGSRGDQQVALKSVEETQVAGRRRHG